MMCNSPLRTREECLVLIERHDWVEIRFSDEMNASLTAGFLRNNGVIARIDKTAPISMFPVGQKATLLVVREQEEMAMGLLDELQQQFGYCPTCGHVLFAGEECSYCEK